LDCVLAEYLQTVCKVKEFLVDWSSVGAANRNTCQRVKEEDVLVVVLLCVKLPEDEVNTFWFFIKVTQWSNKCRHSFEWKNSI
jgi:hypothetical protein